MSIDKKTLLAFLPLFGIIILTISFYFVITNVHIVDTSPCHTKGGVEISGGFCIKKEALIDISK